MTPRQSASGTKTWMPPGPQQYTFPAESIFIPSGAPGPSPTVSAHTRPPESAPSASTSNTRMWRRAVSLLKSRRPAREEQRPLGRSQSSTSRTGALGEQAAGGDPLEGDVGADDPGEARVPDRDAHVFIRSPGLPATYQSGGSTSSTTTQTASFGSLVTSVIASVTRLAISSLRSLPQPS